MPTIRIVNPKRSSPRRRANRRRSRKQNPLGGELLLMTNPHRRRSHGRRNPRRESSRRRNPRGRHISRHDYELRYGHKRNPRIRRSSRRHRNPSLGGVDLRDLGIASVGAAVGSIATRGLTQVILGSKNQGATGYAGNLVVAAGLTYLGSRVGGRTFGLGIGAGAVGGILLRVWQERVSGTGASGLSGLGDLDFEGLGDFVQTAFPVPTVSQQVGNYQVVQAPPYGAGMPAPVPAALPAKGGTAAAGASASAPAAPAGGTAVGRFAPRHAA